MKSLLNAFIRTHIQSILRLAGAILLLTAVLVGCSPASVPGSPIGSASPDWQRVDLPTQKPTAAANIMVTEAENANATTPTAAISTPGKTPSAPTLISTPTNEVGVLVAATAAEERTPTPSPVSEDWKKLPVLPSIPENVKQIFQRGQQLGNNPNAFSKIGDCGSTPAWFLGDFDRGDRFYKLGDYENLSSVIDYYQGSFDRTSLAARWDLTSQPCLCRCGLTGTSATRMKLRLRANTATISLPLRLLCWAQMMSGILKNSNRRCAI